jgi:hypothetical protein
MSLVLIVISLLIIRSSLIYINELLRVKINGANPTPNRGPTPPSGSPGEDGGTPNGPNDPSGGQPSGGKDKAFFENKNISKYKRKSYEKNREAKRKRDERDVLLAEQDPEAYDAKVERYKFNTRAKRVMTLEEYERRKKLREKRDLTNMRNRYNSSFDLNLEGRSAEDIQRMIEEGNRIREGYVEGNAPQIEQNPPVSYFAPQTEQNPPVSQIENISQSQGFIDVPNQNVGHYPTHDSRFTYTLRDNEVIPYNSQSQTYFDYSMQNPPRNS